MTETKTPTAVDRFARLALVAGLGLAGGCVGNKERLPATPTQDPFLNSGGVNGRPASTVAPAPRNEQSNAVVPDRNGAAASTTSRPNTEMAPQKSPSATLMAPAESVGQSPASLAMQSAAKTAGGPAAAGVQQAQWQSQNPQGGVEQALARLQQLGVLEQRLELRGGQWQFTCDAPNPQNPQQRRRYEAADATALGAVKGVLDKLEAAR